MHVILPTKPRAARISQQSRAQCIDEDAYRLLFTVVRLQWTAVTRCRNSWRQRRCCSDWRTADVTCCASCHRTAFSRRRWRLHLIDRIQSHHVESNKSTDATHRSMFELYLWCALHCLPPVRYIRPMMQSSCLKISVLGMLLNFNCQSFISDLLYSFMDWAMTWRSRQIFSYNLQKPSCLILKWCSRKFLYHHTTDHFYICNKYGKCGLILVIPSLWTQQ